MIARRFQTRLTKSVKFPIIRYNSNVKLQQKIDPSEPADGIASKLADKNDGNPDHVATWLEALREREKYLAEGKVLDSYIYINPKTYDVGEKTRQDSFSYVKLPFKQDAQLCDSYINANGRLRVGQLFQDLDALAGKIAYKHCSPAEPVNVTASVDRIYMVKKVDEISNYNFVLAGSCTYTGRSSMEITVKGYAYEDGLPKDINLNSLNDSDVFITANFTFVARDPQTHKSFAINKLLPITEKDWLDYRRAESHNAKKKLTAKSSAMIEPTPEEYKLINDIWKSLKTSTPPRHFEFMNDTAIHSTLVMQPQYRNRHSYMIFGGYLLRQAFELGYCCAGAFSHANPRFVSLDSTNFKAPVPVGSVLSLKASVSYTEHIHSGECNNDYPFNLRITPTNKISKNPDAFVSEPGTLIQVKVDTKITPLDGEDSKDAGTFVYSFFVPQSSQHNYKYRTVIPQTYEEMMTYLEGRRSAQDTANYADTLSNTKH